MSARTVRGTVAAVAAVGLLIGGWLVWWHATRFHEHVSAARGALPAPLGSGAPDAPDRVVRRTSDSYGVDGALSIDAVGDGIVARDLRTGKDYWRYGRDDTELGRVGFAGDTVASWWRDGVVVATDVRTGKPRWHAQVSYGDPDGAGDRDFASIALINGRVLTESRDELTAFAADDGKLVWRAAIPKGCGLDSGGVFSVLDAVVARARCTGTKDDDPLLLGFDIRRGTLRWRVTNGLGRLLRADDHTLVTSSWTGLKVGAVVDVSGDQAVVRTLPFPDEYPSRAAGSGLMLCEDVTGQVQDGTLVAFDIVDGRPRWTRHPSAGTRFGQPLMADGRVYVVAQPSLSKGATSGGYGVDLVVLDAGTGRQLHATRLSATPPDGASQIVGPGTQLGPWQAGDGVVVLGWEGMFSSPVGDLLVVAE
jgi:outer membrane protein assembly factor BamB